MIHAKLKGYLAGYLPLNLIQALTALGIVVIYSRLLSPEHYGRFALAVICLQWLQSLSFYWLQGGVLRFYEVNRTQGRLPALLTTAFRSAAVLSGAIVLVTAIILPYLDSTWAWLVLAGLVNLVARAFLLIGLEAHRAARQVQRYSLLEGTYSLLGLALGSILVIVTGGGAASALWGTALAGVFALAINSRNLIGMMRPSIWSSVELRELIGYGMPLAVGTLLNQIVASADRFFVAAFIDERAVGLYSVAYALADRPSAIIFNWVAMAALPLAFAGMANEGPSGARRVMESTAKTLILLMLPSTVGLAAIAEPLAAVVVGPEYRSETALLIPWIALASLLYGLMVHYSAHAFQITRNTRALLVSYSLVLVINIVLNILLIPRYGLGGAVAASMVTYGFGLALQCAMARRFLPIPWAPSHLIRAILACCVMFAAIRAAPIPDTLSGLMLAILLGICSYCAMAIALNVADIRRSLFTGRLSVLIDRARQ